MSTRAPTRAAPRPSSRTTLSRTPSLSLPPKPAAPAGTTAEVIDMPRPNQSQSPVKRRAPMADSLGKVRVYFDLDITMSIALTMLSAKHYMTKRDYLEHLIREALREDPNLAKSIGVA